MLGQIVPCIAEGGRSVIDSDGAVKYRLLKILQAVGVEPIGAEEGVVAGHVFAVVKIGSPAVRRQGIVVSAGGQLIVEVLVVELDGQ
ncbi:hypothetical protein SDC9_197211 [bioreactor metagenome]|uniref:Uncharacterized protein n=1 Tax=bioreactor metagenome TaxID=1076179 RepID=A0A645IGJ9_9ZZZZ